jgi:CheY-like chemotaxis protein/DNA-binding MarR family transcriptional regulator
MGVFSNISMQQKVIVVDAQYEARVMLCRLLSALGYKVVEASTGTAALDLIREQDDIKFAILNIALPDFDSLCLIKEIRQRHRSCEDLSILVTAENPNTKKIVECIKEGVVDYIDQPLKISSISKALNEAEIERSKRRQNKKSNYTPIGSVMSSKICDFSPDCLVGNSENISSLEKESDFDEKLNLRSLIKWRKRREHLFNLVRFSDPKWDILLELTNVKAEGVEAPLSSIYSAANVPPSTAARHVRELLEKGVVSLHKDPLDKRRFNLSLTEDSFKRMRQFLGQIDVSL